MAKITEVPSPFCGVGTDDLVVEVDGTTLTVKENGCAVNTPAFEQAISDLKPRINGEEVELEQAVAKAAELLANSHQPLIGGCASDVNGMRGVLAVADHCGAVVDNINFNAARRNYLTMQDSGWMNTTLAEIKNRCDLLVVVGVDLEAFSPRFFEQYIWCDDAMYLDNAAARQIVYLGKAPSGAASTSPDGKAAKVLACDDADLPELLAVLAALLKKQPLQVEAVAGIALPELQALAEQLMNAKYGVISWAASALDFSQAELTVQSICNTVKEINDLGVRCSGFPLGGKEGDVTANQVSGWITGYPARVAFNRGYPEYDPFLYDGMAMLSNGEVDVLLWVEAFNSEAAPPSAGIPTIAVGRSGMQFEKEPDVFIPVGTPGIDHAGHAYRLDNVVALRLKKLRDSGLPSTAEVLNAIENLLQVKNAD